MREGREGTDATFVYACLDASSCCPPPGTEKPARYEDQSSILKQSKARGTVSERRRRKRGREMEERERARVTHSNPFGGAAHDPPGLVVESVVGFPPFPFELGVGWPPPPPPNIERLGLKNDMSRPGPGSKPYWPLPLPFDDDEGPPRFCWCC